MINHNCVFCLASHSYQSVRAETVYGGSKEHKFYRCNKCDLVYLWPVPSKKEQQEFYENKFEEFMSNRTGPERDWRNPEVHIQTNQDNINRRLPFINDYFSQGKNVLEIGCSSGYMMETYKSAGMHPIGIEPSKTFRESLIKKGFEVYSNLEDLMFNKPALKFDLITHYFVIEHIKDTVSFIKNQLRMLNKDGIIIAEVPCIQDPLVHLYDIPSFDNFYWIIAHYYYFSPKSISNILNNIKCKYKLIPEQRYDLSNHMGWMQYGKPGYQDHYNNIFSSDTINNYKTDLKNKWMCDTMFLYIWK